MKSTVIIVIRWILPALLFCISDVQAALIEKRFTADEIPSSWDRYPMDYHSTSLWSYISGNDSPVSSGLAFSKTFVSETLGEPVETPTLTADIPEDIDIIWSSSNPDVAEVNDAGQIIQRGSGETVITASTEESGLVAVSQASYTLELKSFESQYPEILEIELSEPGTLENAVKESGALRVEAIRVKGSINASDIIFLNNRTGRIANLTYIDLSKAEPEASDVIYFTRKVSSDIGMGGDIYYYYISDSESFEFMGSSPTGLGGGVSEYKVGSTNLAYAFYEQQGLKYVALPDNLNGMGDGIFGRCEDLKIASLPQNVTSIPLSAFERCPSLTMVNGLDSAITEVGDNAFYQSENFHDLSWAENLTSIGASAFKWCGLQQIKLELSRIKSIGANAFEDCGFRELVFGDRLSQIGAYAFTRNNLISVKIGKGITTLGSLAFGRQRKQSLKYVEMGAYPLYVGSGVFEESKWYKDIPAENGVKYYGPIALGSVNGTTVLNIKDGTITVADGVGSNKITDFNLPSTLRVLGGWFFCDNSVKKTIALPENLEYVGNRCFYKAAGLCITSFPETLRYIGSEAFSGTDIPVIYVPKNVEFIGREAFNHVNAIKIKYDATDAEAGFSIFTDSTVEEVEVGESVRIIPEMLFYMLYNYNLVLPENGVPGFSIGDNAFSNGFSNKELVLPKNTVSVGKRAFDGYNKEEKTLESVTLNEGLVHIGQEAFADQSKVMVWNIPATVESIGERAFLCRRRDFSAERTLILNASVAEVDDEGLLCNAGVVDCIALDAPFDISRGFSDAPSQTTVKVNSDSAGAFMSDPVWNKYKIVVEPSEVEEIFSDVADMPDFTKPYVAYNLQGQMMGTDVCDLSRGIYIIVQDHKTYKYNIR